MTREQHPRLLWVTPTAPDHEGGGDQLRQAFLLDHVARHFEVTLMCPEQLRDPACNAALTRLVRIPTVNTPPWSRFRAVWWLIFGRQPWYVRQSLGLRHAVGEVLQDHLNEADLVVVEHMELAPLIDHRSGQPWVLTLHVSHSRQASHRAVAADSWAQRRFHRTDAARARRFEERLGDWDMVVTTSVEDASGVRGRVRVVPNGVDSRGLAAGPLPPAARVLFTGSLDYEPNVDGIIWFLGAVWPLIRATLPQAQFTIAGRRPVTTITDLVEVSEGVTLIRDPELINPLFKDTRVVVVPIRHGAGTRLKALQGLAAGRVVVGTSIGLEGLSLTDRDTALFADSAEAFAEAVITACRDNELAVRLAERGRLHAEPFDWENVAKTMLDVLDEVGSTT